MSYYVGDSPVEPFIVPVPEHIDPTDYPLLAAVIQAPGGTELGPLVAVYGADEDGEPVVIVEPGGDTFTAAGIYSVRVTASNVADALRRLPAELFVVESEDWHTLDSARAEWPTEGTYTDVQLFRLLEAAKRQCIEYAPALAADAPIPSSWLDAQIMQARNIANAAKTDPGQSPDGGLFVIRPYPMDKFVRNLLRPERAVPVIG